MLAILAGTEEEPAIPANVGLTSDVAAADTAGNRVAARRKGYEVIEFYGIGDLQPVLAERAEIEAGFVGQNDMADFEDGFVQR